MLSLILGDVGLALLLVGVAWALAILLYTRPAKRKATRCFQQPPPAASKTMNL